jgi:hypothetical protein
MAAFESRIRAPATFPKIQVSYSHPPNPNPANFFPQRSTNVTFIPARDTPARTRSRTCVLQSLCQSTLINLNKLSRKIILHFNKKMLAKSTNMCYNDSENG